MRRLLCAVALLSLSVNAGAPLAQQTATRPQTSGTQLDRKKVPPAGKPPVLRVPAWTTTKLSNGATLNVSQRRGLPLVSFNITFVGGANQFERPGRVGIASLTAAMMREGTKTRDGEQLAQALQLLGTNVSIGVGGESGSISFLSTTEKFPATLEIMADMLLNPTFPTPALDRLRAQRLVALTQANAQPNAIGNRVFSRVLYGGDHPFGRDVTETSLKAITTDDVASFHKDYFKPGRAIITVTGDVDAAGVKATIEKALAAWGPGGEKPSFAYPPLPAGKPTTIYLVDKPGAAQSVFNIGIPGPPRNTPDYMALQVMNFILGGHFQSRLNANIREEKGYSYGVNSGFSYGKGPGPFRAGGDVVSEKTDLALIEFMKELKGIQGDKPITDEELTMAKETLVQRLPGQFASVAAIGSSITSLMLQDLPADYYQNFAKNVAAITKDDVVRAAKKYVDLDHLNIVIVGDRKTIEEPLRKTGIAPIVILDSEGNPKQ